MLGRSEIVALKTSLRSGDLAGCLGPGVRRLSQLLVGCTRSPDVQFVFAVGLLSPKFSQPRVLNCVDSHRVNWPYDASYNQEQPSHWQYW